MSAPAPARRCFGCPDLTVPARPGVRYISEVVYHYPDLFQLMGRCSGRLPRPTDTWIRAADESVRPALFPAFESPTDVPASRRQLKNVPQLPVPAAVPGGNYATELQERGVKRKLSASIAAAVSPAALAEIYLAAIALVPRKPRVPRPLVARLSAKHGVDADTVTTAVLHAIEQRGAFCAAKAPAVVARAQRAAVGGDCYVKVCAFCSSIRDRIGKLKANKSTGEVVVHGSTASTVLDPLPPEDEAGVPVRRLGGEYQCANCRLYGGMWVNTEARAPPIPPFDPSLLCPRQLRGAGDRCVLSDVSPARRPLSRHEHHLLRVRASFGPPRARRAAANLSGVP